MRARIWTGVPAVALAAVLVASGCGSDNGDDGTDRQTTEETTTDQDSDGGDLAEDEEDDPAPDPADIPDAPDDEADDDGALEEMTDAEAVELMQGIWRSQDDENRLLVVEGTVVGLLDDGTECHGEHNEGPIPITLTLECEGEDTPRIANTAVGEGVLVLGWETDSGAPEMYAFVGGKEDVLD